MSASPKNEFLKNLQNLTKTEQSIVQKFESDATGASFVPVADLLRSRGYIEEAIVILEDGLLKYPLYSSARASLAKDYLSLGMLHEALEQAQRVLEQGPDNALAQRICLKLHVLFNRREDVLNRLKTIEKIVPDDEITQAIRKAIASGDWGSAQKWVKTDLERAGIHTSLYENAQDQPNAESVSFLQDHSRKERDETAVPSAAVERAASLRQSWSLPLSPAPQEFPNRQGAQASAQNPIQHPASSLHEPSLNLRFPSDKHLPEALRSGSSLANVKGDVDRYLLLKGFKTVQIGAFLLNQSNSLISVPDSVEKRTIAAIYKSQGLHLKALEAYESLIQEDPKNSSYQAEYQELKQLIKKEFFSQREDAEVVQSKQEEEKELESSRKKIQTLKQILGKLEEGT